MSRFWIFLVVVALAAYLSWNWSSPPKFPSDQPKEDPAEVQKRVARAREIIKEAIEAHGGEKAVEKTLTGSIKTRAKIPRTPNVFMEVTTEERFRLPEQFNRVCRWEENGKQITEETDYRDRILSFRRNNDNWDRKSCPPLPRAAFWHAMLALLPKLLEQDCQLGQVLQEQNPDWRQMDGITVTSVAASGQFYFDKETKLLSKWKGSINFPPGSNEVIEGEVAYSDYKEKDGVKFPRKLTFYINGIQNGDQVVEKVDFGDKGEGK
jgi:hypothetical protein